MSVSENFKKIASSLPSHVTLVAVSKTKPIDLIQEVYDHGHVDFGENYVQELVDKHDALPEDIHWHFIGHLQSNKVKYIAPFVYLIHGVDSLKLLKEINKQGLKNNRVIDVLLQVHIAQEETKFGLSEEELDVLLKDPLLSEMKNVRIRGLMGMASFTENKTAIKDEFHKIKLLFNRLDDYPAQNISADTLSIGMSGDYELAISEGSTMVRIGSSIFGVRNYSA